MQAIAKAAAAGTTNGQRSTDTAITRVATAVTAAAARRTRHGWVARSSTGPSRGR